MSEMDLHLSQPQEECQNFHISACPIHDSHLVALKSLKVRADAFADNQSSNRPPYVCQNFNRHLEDTQFDSSQSRALSSAGTRSCQRPLQLYGKDGESY